MTIVVQVVDAYGSFSIFLAVNWPEWHDCALMAIADRPGQGADDPARRRAEPARPHGRPIRRLARGIAEGNTPTSALKRE